MSSQYTLDDMWRRSDKSYIHPTDMNDIHIINAIKKATAKFSTLFQLPDYTHYSMQEWEHVLREDSALIKLFTEATKRNIIPIQRQSRRMFPDTVAPIASAISGTDISRCFSCDSVSIGVNMGLCGSASLEKGKVWRVHCKSCGVTVERPDKYDAHVLWNALFIRTHRVHQA